MIAGEAQSIVGGPTPGLVALGSIRKQAEQARGKSVSKHPHGLCSNFCLQVLALCKSLIWPASMINNDLQVQATLSSPICFCSRCFSIAIITLTKALCQSAAQIAMLCADLRVALPRGKQQN